MIYPEEVKGKFAIDVMEFVFVFATAFSQVVLINLSEIFDVVRTLWIYTFVDNKAHAVLFWNNSI